MNLMQISKDHWYGGYMATNPVSYEITLFLKPLYIVQTPVVESTALNGLGMSGSPWMRQWTPGLVNLRSNLSLYPQYPSEGLAWRSYSINACWNNLWVLTTTKTSSRILSWPHKTVAGTRIRGHLDASSSWLPHFFVFSLTDGSVVSLPIWFLNSEHDTWRRGAFHFSFCDLS